MLLLVVVCPFVCFLFVCFFSSACLWSVVYALLFVFRRWLCVGSCSLLVVRCLFVDFCLFGMCCLMFVVCCLLLFAICCCWLFVVCSLLLVAGCLLFVVCCGCCDACCLFIVWCWWLFVVCFEL